MKFIAGRWDKIPFELLILLLKNEVPNNLFLFIGNDFVQSSFIRHI